MFVGGVVLKKTKAEGAGWIVIAIGWGLAVTMGVYAVGSISGAHLNPAVTIGFASIGEFPWDKVPLYILAQLIGGFIGGVIVFFSISPTLERNKRSRGSACSFFQRVLPFEVLFRIW